MSDTTHDSTAFYLKRLMSITGLLPVGGFLVQHIFSNSYIFNSPQVFNEHSEFLLSFPRVVLIELALIYFPIFLHAALGIVIVYKSQNNFAQYGFFRNWMFFFQRLTGLVALIYIIVHSYTTRIHSFLTHQEFHAANMSQTLSQPFWFWFYFVGIICVVFHFSNGIWNFLVTWGIIVGKKAQKIATALTMALFVAMSLWCVQILLQF